MIFLKEIIVRIFIAFVINIFYTFVFMIISYFVEKVRQKNDIPDLNKINFTTVFITNFIIIFIILLLFVRETLL